MGHDAAGAFWDRFAAEHWERRPLVFRSADLGIAPGTIYTYVESKDALFRLVVERVGLESGGRGRFGLWTRDGGALLTARRDRGDRTPAVLLTAREEADLRDRATAAGADAYLAKPFAYPELLACIARFTGEE